jgi:lipid-A-disaccharide synthase-like uncharacterized protein
MSAPWWRQRTARLGIVLVAILAGLGVGWAHHAVAQPAPRPQEESAATAGPGELTLRIKPLPAEVRRVTLEDDGAGGRLFVVQWTDGRVERLSPDAFAELLSTTSRGRGFMFKLLNITSPVGFAWVALGLLGQVFFTGRMILQWLVSEYRKRSVVPAGFWWMSLIGATMLLIYFIWRRDIVGIIGQCTGWFIYVRNLWFIYRDKLRGAQTRSESAMVR